MAEILEKIDSSRSISQSRKENLTKIIRFLQNNSKELSYISFGTIERQLSGVEKGEILESIMMLSSGFNVLEIQYEYYDGENNAHPIERSDLREAIEEGVFYDPVFGEPIKDFEKSIVMFFIQSDQFKSLF